MDVASPGSESNKNYTSGKSTATKRGENKETRTRDSGILVEAFPADMSNKYIVSSRIPSTCRKGRRDTREALAVIKIIRFRGR